MTQEELASAAGIGLRTVREIEAGRVGRPQQGTLERLADAMGLGPHDRQLLFRTAWAGAGESSFSKLADTSVDIESVLEDKAWTEQGQRTVSLELETVIGSDGRQLRQSERRVAQMIESGVRHYWTLFGSSGDVDVARIQVTETVGAELDRRVVIRGDEPSVALLALRWRLNENLAVGERWFHSVAFNFSEAQESAAPDNFWLLGNGRGMSVLALVLRFAQLAPRKVFETGGSSRTKIKRRRLIEPQADGVFVLIYPDPTAGVRGFEWEW